MRVVVDANVVIAALLRPAGPTRRMLETDLHAWFAPVTLLDEVREHEVELSDRLGAPVARWRRSVDRLAPFVGWVPTADFAAEFPKALELCGRDPDDAPYVACALSLGADFLWTHDRALAAAAPCRAGPWPQERSGKSY